MIHESVAFTVQFIIANIGIRTVIWDLDSSLLARPAENQSEQAG